jgi:hypothetical protein
MTCLQYLILDAIRQGCSIDSISNELGVQQALIQSSLDSLRPSYVDDDNRLTDDFISMYDGIRPPERIKKRQEPSELPSKVIDLFNKINETKYRVDTYYSNILKISKEVGENIDIYHSVILHKNLTWGQDEKMSEYNRPATIFRNVVRFKQYLDDARLYWIKESTK